MTARDHLLMTLAPVAPGTRVVVSQCGNGAGVEALHRLGFEVWACDADPAAVEMARCDSELDESDTRLTVGSPTALGYPDGFAGWGAIDLGRVSEDWAESVAEVSRTVAFGGWIWVRVAGEVAEILDLELPVGVVPAEAPRAVEDGAVVIFRRVNADVVA